MTAKEAAQLREDHDFVARKREEAEEKRYREEKEKERKALLSTMDRLLRKAHGNGQACLLVVRGSSLRYQYRGGPEVRWHFISEEWKFDQFKDDLIKRFRDELGYDVQVHDRVIVVSWGPHGFMPLHSCVVS